MLVHQVVLRARIWPEPLRSVYWIYWINYLVNINRYHAVDSGSRYEECVNAAFRPIWQPNILMLICFHYFFNIDIADHDNRMRFERIGAFDEYLTASSSNRVSGRCKLIFSSQPEVASPHCSRLNLLDCIASMRPLFPYHRSLIYWHRLSRAVVVRSVCFWPFFPSRIMNCSYLFFQTEPRRSRWNLSAESGPFDHSSCTLKWRELFLIKVQYDSRSSGSEFNENEYLKYRKYP